MGIRAIEKRGIDASQVRDSIFRSADTSDFPEKGVADSTSMKPFTPNYDFCKTSIYQGGSRSIPLQPKITINQPNDKDEQQADAVADQVIMRNTPLSRNVHPSNREIIQRKCKECEEEEEDKRKKIQRKEIHPGPRTAPDNFTSYVKGLSKSGQPLSEQTRSFFEGKFNHDFSKVRIHVGNEAAQSAQSINALAYSYGNNIVFNHGQFNPNSRSGKRLLAHELTHTIQQAGSGEHVIQRQAADHCVKGIVEGKGEVVDDKSMPNIVYVIWGTFKVGQTNRDFIEQTLKKWFRWRYGELDAGTLQKMFEYASPSIWSGSKVGDDCQHAIPIARDVMAGLRKLAGEEEKEQKGKDEAKIVIGETENQRKEKPSAVKSNLSVLKDADLAKHLLLLLEHYAHRSISEQDRNMAGDGLSEEEVSSLIGTDAFRRTIVLVYTQGYDEYVKAGGKALTEFYKLSDRIIEQLSRGNPTAAHNLLEIGTGISGMTLPDGRDEGKILGIVHRQSRMLLYNSEGEQLPGLAGVGMRDKGYTAARNDSSWGINIANIEDPAIRSLLNALRQSVGDQARMTVEAAKIYYDNCELVNAKVKAGLSSQIIKDFEDMLPVFVGFLSGHALSSFLMRVPNPPVVAVGAVLKGMLTAAGYVMNIEFGVGALQHLMQAAYHLTRIEKTEKGELTKLSGEHLEKGAIPIRKMVSDIALMAATHGFGKLLKRIKSNEAKGKIECTHCDLTEGVQEAGKKVEGGAKPKYKFSDIPSLRQRAIARIKGLVNIGSTDLSIEAMEYRKTNKISPDRNIAVAEYLDASGELKTRVEVSKRGEGHSERKLGDFMEFNDLSPERLIRLYTERQPCAGGGGYCARFLNNIYSNAVVTWSINAGENAAKILSGVAE